MAMAHEMTLEYADVLKAAEKIADEACQAVNREAITIRAKHRGKYTNQLLLETLIRVLEERV